MATDTYSKKRGDTFVCPKKYPYRPGGLTFDLTDDSRWLVEGQARVEAGDDEVRAIFDFNPTYLADGDLLPILHHSITATLTPGVTYTCDAQVTDLDGVYGVESTVTFKLKILQDVTRALIGSPPVGLYTQDAEPDDDHVDDGDFWFDTTVNPAVVKTRVAGAWVTLVTP